MFSRNLTGNLTASLVTLHRPFGHLDNAVLCTLTDKPVHYPGPVRERKKLSTVHRRRVETMLPLVHGWRVLRLAARDKNLESTISTCMDKDYTILFYPFKAQW